MGLFSRLARTKSLTGLLDPQTVPSPTGAGYAVVDVETTGLSATQNRIVELGIVCVDTGGDVTAEWVSRFNPQGPMGASHIHGIYAEDVANAPLFGDRVTDIIPLLRGRVVVAHNAVFDLAFLRTEFARAGWVLPEVPAFCTLQASWFYLPSLNGRRLPDCCEAAGIRLDSCHVAIEDARATAGLLRLFMDPRTPPAPLDEHLALLQRASAMSWPTAPTHQPSTSPAPVSTATPQRHSRSIRPTPTLLLTLADYSFEDALDEGAPTGSAAYLQLVLEVLEDGELTIEEGFALTELASEYGLSADDLVAAHRGFLLALARKAVADDHVSREERDELRLVARLLALSEKLVPDVLGDARGRRAVALGEGLPPLPDDWALGEPLRTGDRIAFTGCEQYGRRALEQRAIDRGISISGGVSRKTALLVSDGTVFGTKALAAREYGTRVVHPDELLRLLTHVQPAVSKPDKPPARAKAVAGPTKMASETDPSVIRQWARSNGFDVGARGRLHQDVIDAYMCAHDLSGTVGGL